MKTIDQIRDRLAAILRETGDNTTGLDCSARRRAVMALLRAAVAEIDRAEWNILEAANYLDCSTGWLIVNGPGGIAARHPTHRIDTAYRIRYDALRAFKEQDDVMRREALTELARLTQELGDPQ